MENVEKFIDQLIDEKGLGVEGDVRKQLKLDMMERLLDQIDRASINALPEDKAIELADKLDDENFTDEQVADFMKDSGVDLERVALETMLQFRLLYLGGNASVDVEAMEKANEENDNNEENAE
ncbi:hypothetical protein IKQ38_02280 [Candidatus Saccharibacteria bacterium]|nr:hypothetical protein [Candidatus Saccharibacteria bacterium]